MKYYSTRDKNVSLSAAEAVKIMDLPDVTSDDFRVAFGIPINRQHTPQWFIYNGKAYLCSRYPLGEEYETIPIED